MEDPHLRSSLRAHLVAGYGALTRAFRRHPGKRVIALHEVRDRALFRAKLEWLKENYEIVGLETLFERDVQGRSMVALTFDDGYQCWHEDAAPILQELGVEAVFFVCSGLVGLQRSAADRFFKERLGRRQLLTPLTLSGLRDIARQPGFEIGSHTHSHVDFSAISDQAIAENEIGRDVEQLEDWSGRRVRFFAYPFGNWPQILSPARQCVERAGFEAAFSIIPSFLNSSTDRAAVGRDSLEVRAAVRVWQSSLEGACDPYYALKGKLWKWRLENLPGDPRT